MAMNIFSKATGINAPEYEFSFKLKLKSKDDNKNKKKRAMTKREEDDHNDDDSIVSEDDGGMTATRGGGGNGRGNGGGQVRVRHHDGDEANIDMSNNAGSACCFSFINMDRFTGGGKKVNKKTSAQVDDEA
jgi:hypothetical protein